MADYDVRAFIEKRNAAMARNSSANQQAAQSMRAAGISNVGGKATTSSARDIQERFGRGLGSRTDPATPDVEEEDVGGVKSFMNSIFDWFNSSGASEPKMPPSYDGSSVYERSEFDIRPTPVTSSVLDAAPTGYDPYGIDTLNFGKGVDTNTDTAPETPESAKIDVFDPLNMKEKVQRDSETPGLMTPPSAEQPSVTGGKSLLTEAPETIRKTIESIMLTDPDVPYVIQAGDTLSEIAAKTGTTVNELQKLNKIKKANEIFAGDELIIPSNKSTKTKEDIVSSLIGGMGGVSELGSSFEGDGVQTAMSIVPSSVISDAIEATQLEDTLFDAIVIGESEDFDTVYKGVKIQPSKPITQMTVKEVRDWQKANVKAGAVSTAAGRFQIVGGTMKDLIKKGTISEDDIFDEATQRKAYKGLLEKRGYSKFKNKMSKAITENEKQKIAEDFLQGLAQEFASIPIPKDLPNRKNPLTKKGLKKGDSYYEGRFGNTTKGNPKSVDDYIEILKEFNTDPTTLVPPARPAGLMDKYTIPRPQLRPENL